MPSASDTTCASAASATCSFLTGPFRSWIHKLKLLRGYLPEALFWTTPPYHHMPSASDTICTSAASATRSFLASSADSSRPESPTTPYTLL